jgi:hypothetical protein
MQDHAANKLDVEMAHLEHSPPGFSHDGEGIGEQAVESFSLVCSVSEQDRLFSQFIVVESSNSRLAAINLGD